ncbi:zinc ABC transporter substrate-binding protein [Loktanella sp. SALINAS62]|uniref:zinc ABC transporter substrate-binding protein n=1 Tax=Loktanella sp. SALINAS62 TaxID=2706124 RepID=UPI002012D37B|nr:zinc ABC transporter substrate-binding protein [Loktanella sp. SALINAS62]
MSRNLAPLTAAAALLAGTALADAPAVAVDIAPVHSLVARVMDGVGAPSLIVAPGATPHEYSLRPSEAAALQGADLVFWVSADLTPWLGDAIGTLATNAAVFELLETEGTTELPVREGALFEVHAHENDDTAEHSEDHADHDDHDAEHTDDHAGDADDHAAGHDDHADDHASDDAEHDHGDHDPHAWLSPDNASVWLDVIARALSDADPENAATYTANADAGQQELDSLRAEIDAILAPVRDAQFIVFHDAFQYFENAFDFPSSGAISVSDATDPSPSRVAEIQARVAQQDVTCVLSEPQFNPGIMAAVMDGSPARSGVLDPLGSDLEPGAALYPDMLRNLATALADCL